MNTSKMSVKQQRDFLEERNLTRINYADHNLQCTVKKLSKKEKYIAELEERLSVASNTDSVKEVESLSNRIARLLKKGLPENSEEARSTWQSMA